ncbi:hypothetical protein E1267_02275 [Nonomuraea longispora]|uniref:Uncharacterized protein n=1 Tax=Nonomuraea longispora TaxID=1848320 RepID=A0A4R4NP26_9ACTN|nr:hypothetical protein [Nonomuraea longispora]TDC11035.1 hypothetical protein E1267_02275 [Nonomuraea longispora]
MTFFLRRNIMRVLQRGQRRTIDRFLAGYGGPVRPLCGYYLHRDGGAVHAGGPEQGVDHLGGVLGARAAEPIPPCPRVLIPVHDQLDHRHLALELRRS